VTKLMLVNGVASIDVPHWRACSVAALALPSSAVDDDAQSFIVQTSLTGAVAAPTPKTTPAQPKPHPKAKPKHQRKRRKR